MRRLHTNKGFLITSTARLPGGSVGHIHEAGRTTKERQQSAAGAARCLTTGSTPWRQIPCSVPASDDSRLQTEASHRLHVRGLVYERNPYSMKDEG